MKDTVAFKKNITQAANLLQSLQSDFTQEKYMSILEDKMTYKGVFYFQKEHLLRWEYKSPLAYVIVFHKNKIFVKDEGKVNKFDTKSNKMFQSLNEMMLNAVSGNMIDHKNFSHQFYENEKNYRLEAAPRKKIMQESLKNIEIFFDKKDYSVTEVRLHEPSGDYTFIKFSNKKVNEKIPANLFVIK